jgi:hypothetical protein
MLRHYRWAFPVLVLCLSIGHAAEEPKEPKKANGKEDPARSNEMILQFHDGTMVRMLTLQDNLEVQTKYGKLTVPTTDVRRIEFGLHMSEDISRRVDEALRDLDSNDFQVREDAGKKLVALGRFAYPALVKASKGSSLELTRRVQGLIKSIRDKYPAYQLKMKDDDTVHTNGFVIVGKIETPTIKARTEHFGDAQLKIADLRGMRSAVGSGEAEVVVDASKYGSAPNQWMETDVNVVADVKLLITAAGEVDVYASSPGQYISGPDGNNQLGRRGAHLPGQLLGRIGQNGPVFPINSRYEGTPTQDGKLYLHIFPMQGGGGATGNYTVKVGPAD